MKNSQLRVSYSKNILSKPIASSEDTYVYLVKVWDKRSINLQEQLYIIFLNNNNEVISWRCLNTGTCSETLFDIKLALACALICMASKIIIAHNHPSGRLQPSSVDIAITEQLNKAAALMDIKLFDHLIITGRDYYSFRDNFLLKG